MSKQGGEDVTGTTPLTRADIPELVKVVSDALTKRDTPENPGRPAGAEGSKSGGQSCPAHAN